ncbi:hypothetical protein ATANTOWER_011462 [Ataeniobius toweri]|uniref:Uncharacterized protein n=1 Tax=Ataeniobius toweri TaxID=208326 RepID=A0ABU7BPM4_9TELE|nr:hypothetical protein [Ataeniobius toweri]
MKTFEYYIKPNLISFRSEVSKFQLSSSTRAEQQPCVSRGQGQRCCQDLHHDRCSPTGRAVTTPDKMEEQLFRSVEGQAASDEEEDRRTEEQQRQVEEVKRILTRLSCCGQRCGDKAMKKLTFNLGSLRSEESHSAVVELLERVTRLHKELELKESQAEMNMDQNVSRRSLGKMLLSSLESGSNPQHGKAHILEVLNALYHELAACEILSSDGPLQKTQSQQSLHDLIFYC